MMKCALHSFESVEIVSDLNVGLKVGSQVIALGLNKEDLGSYSRQELHNRFFFFQLVLVLQFMDDRNCFAIVKQCLPLICLGLYPLQLITTLS